MIHELCYMYILKGNEVSTLKKSLYSHVHGSTIDSRQEM